VRRAYGDSTSTQVNPWKDELLKYSVQPIQQFSYTTGKNSADSALIIDAMDLLHGGMVDGFCLVSSDSDFTRLAQRIREQGLLAYGFGERNPPESLVKACTQFIYVENLVGKEAAAKDTAVASATTEATASAATKATATPSKLSLKGDTKLTDLLKAHPSYETVSRSPGDSNPKASVVRSKPSK